MFKLQNLRLSTLRHFNSLEQLSLTRSRLIKMDPPPSSPGASSRPRRHLTTGQGRPARPDFGYYTRIPTQKSTQRARGPIPSAGTFSRHYHSSNGKHTGSGGLSVNAAYWILFSLNASSFGAWWYARLTENRPLQTNLITHTLASVAAWDSGRWWTVLTSAFTHHDVMHFAFNMLTLRTFCQIIGYVPGIGGGHVLLLALGSAIAGSGGWLWQQRSKIPAAGKDARWRFSNASQQAYYSNALGASGVVMGVSAVATCLLPRMPIYLMFIPVGIPLWVVTLGYAVVDSYYLDDKTSRVAHAGHLGGMFFGAAYYIGFLRNAPVGVWRTITGTIMRKR